ncbi:hypothetical protein E4T56_gene11766 [Termitomyces sp. T112]|nr:hypothetical protein E4T56_gene11766 [Termitomyces sp. T112]
MGSSQSILSPEAAIAVAVVAGAVGVGYSQFGPSGATSSSSTGTEASGKKGKKKKRSSARTSPVPEPSEPSSTSPAPIVVPFPTVIPGGLDDSTTPELEALSFDAPKSTKSKRKKKTKLASSATSKRPDSARPSQTESSNAKASRSTPSTYNDTKIEGKRTTPPSTSATSSPEFTNRQLGKAQSSISVDTDSSWTRVGSRRIKSGRSVDINTNSTSEADPATGTSSPVAKPTDIDADVDEDDHFYTRSSNSEQRRPLAERMLPKPRKTGVESMLETPDNPTLVRVMRVKPQADEQPALGFSWGDYEDAHDADVDGEDDNAGWDVVKSRRSRTIRPSTSEHSLSQSQQKKAPETLTKRQRQNAARREAQKTVKEEAEHERRATLARHQRELENERMKEQAKGRGAKKVSGGMKAVVSESGKLVWE